MKKTPTDAMAAILASATALHNVSAMDDANMAKIKKITARTKTPDLLMGKIVAAKMTGEHIRDLRVANNVSQAVFAGILNTSVSTIQKWETNVNKPQGPALRLLDLIDRKGMRAVY